MTDHKKDGDKKGAAPGAKGDSEKALQEELRREAAEGSGAVGDAAENRNLSGSSTWETLPGAGKAEDASKHKGSK